MKISRWGNSLGVRLPASVVEALDLKEGDDIKVHIVGRREFEVIKAPGKRDILARLRKDRGRMPDDFTFDRLDIHGCG